MPGGVLRSVAVHQAIHFGGPEHLLLAVDGFFSRSGLGQFGFRWIHILFGIAWIGLLYYFNFVQVPAFAAYGDEAKARNIAIDKIARKALWYFRWAAASTFITGLLITGITKDYWSAGLKTTSLSAIALGMLLGTIMMLNVWGVIWRNQKIILANAANVLAGGQADPNVPAAQRKAGMASRQNVVFSVSMLYFMVYKGHGPLGGGEMSGGKTAVFWIISLVIVAVLEINCLGLMPWKATANKGINILYDGKGVQNPIIAAFGLSVVFLVMTEILFR
jgi:uncharacterized membrane protein